MSSAAKSIDHSSLVRVSVAGASGYSGAELVRLLLSHPHVELVHLAAGEQRGRELEDVFPQFQGLISRTLCETDWSRLGRDSDVVLLGLPHGLSMAAVPELLDADARVVDLGGDFRLNSAATYTDWYGVEHSAPELLDEAVYGLPELNFSVLPTARLVANPGCYPTASILALLPIADLLGGAHVVVDAKSGVSGAGRKASMTTHFSEVNENLKAYSVLTHRHTPEIEQVLASVGGGPSLVFVPHLVPMTRGILATCYVHGLDGLGEDELVGRYRALAERAPFVRLLEEGLPQTKATYGSNFCDIGIRRDSKTGTIVVVAAIDNLVKGAAGQAIENLNLMCGFDRTAGLHGAPVFP